MEQDPVAWADIEQGAISWMKGEYGPTWKPLYTHPPRREWVGLTEVDPSVEQLDQIIDLLARTHVRISARELLRVWIVAYTRAIEAKLKEKNT
ncbi:MAG: hypothetical protein EHM17_15075 [Verrucomicrobiaceae bacterium]|nr:MAG: hypothetical protein EHM17_15075 [Verrucomicrobiaceae bacterium]